MPPKKMLEDGQKPGQLKLSSFFKSGTATRAAEAAEAPTATAMAVEPLPSDDAMDVELSAALPEPASFSDEDMDDVPENEPGLPPPPPPSYSAARPRDTAGSQDPAALMKKVDKLCAEKGLSGPLTYQNIGEALGSVRALLYNAHFADDAFLPLADQVTLLTHAAPSARSHNHTWDKAALEVEQAVPLRPRTFVDPKEIVAPLQAALALVGGLEGTSPVVAEERVRGKAKSVVLQFSMVASLLALIKERGIDVESLTPEKAVTFVDGGEFKLPFDRVMADWVTLDVSGAFNATADRAVAAALGRAPDDWVATCTLGILSNSEGAMRDALKAQKEWEAKVVEEKKGEGARAGRGGAPPTVPAKRDHTGARVAASGADTTTAAAEPPRAAPMRRASSAPSPGRPLPVPPAATPPPLASAAQPSAGRPPLASASAAQPSSSAAQPARPARPGSGGLPDEAVDEVDMTDFPLLAQPGGVGAELAVLVNKSHGDLVATVSERVGQDAAAKAAVVALADQALIVQMATVAGFVGQGVGGAIVAALNLPLDFAASFGYDARPTSTVDFTPYMQGNAAMEYGSAPDVAFAKGKLLPAPLKALVAQLEPRSAADAAAAATAVLKVAERAHAAVTADAVDVALGTLVPGSIPQKHVETREGVVRLAACSLSRLFIALQPVVIGHFARPDDAWAAFRGGALQAGLHQSGVFGDEDAELVKGAGAKVANCFARAVSPPARAALGIHAPGPSPPALAEVASSTLAFAFEDREIGPTKPAAALLDQLGDFGATLARRANVALAGPATGRDLLSGLPADRASVLAAVADVGRDALAAFMTAGMAAVMRRSFGALLDGTSAAYAALASPTQNAYKATACRGAYMRALDAMRGAPGTVLDGAKFFGSVLAGGPRARASLSALATLSHPIKRASLRLPSITSARDGEDKCAGAYMGEDGMGAGGETGDKFGVAAGQSLSVRANGQRSVKAPLVSGGASCRVGRRAQPFQAVARVSAQTLNDVPTRLLCLKPEAIFTVAAGPQSTGGVFQFGDVDVVGPLEPPSSFPFDLLPCVVDAALELADVRFDANALDAALCARLAADPVRAVQLERGRIPPPELAVAARAVTGVRDRDALTAAVGTLVDEWLATEDGRALAAKDAGIKDDAPGSMPTLVKHVYGQLTLPGATVGGRALADVVRPDRFVLPHLWALVSQCVAEKSIDIKDDVPERVYWIRKITGCCTPEVGALFFPDDDFDCALDAIKEVWDEPII